MDSGICWSLGRFGSDSYNTVSCIHFVFEMCVGADRVASCVFTRGYIYAFVLIDDLIG